MLPISHDEVVHGKCIPHQQNARATTEQKFAGLRAFMGYMMAHPGKKLLFMGSEFAQFIEWDYENRAGLDAAGLRPHAQTAGLCAQELNHLYQEHARPVGRWTTRWEGFQWIVPDDYDPERHRLPAAWTKTGGEVIGGRATLRPVLREDYRIRRAPR